MFAIIPVCDIFYKVKKIGIQELVNIKIADKINHGGTESKKGHGEKRIVIVLLISTYSLPGFNNTLAH
jgi:hypothetical protein